MRGWDEIGITIVLMHLVTVLDVSSLVPRPIWVLGYDVSSGVARLLVLAGHLLYASLLAPRSRALRARLRDMSGTALAGHVPAQARPSLRHWMCQAWLATPVYC